MNKAEQFHQRVMNELANYSLEKVDHLFKHLESSADPRDHSYFCEIYRKIDWYPCYYYQYLACAARVTKAKQIVEIGADRGVSALMMASEITDGKIYSVDIRDGWEYVPENTPSIIKLRGYSTDPQTWKDVDLSKTDLWLIDGEHTQTQVERECQFFSPFWKPGAVVIFDDLNLNGIPNVFGSLPYDKMEAPNVHGQNVGIVVI